MTEVEERLPQVEKGEEQSVHENDHWSMKGPLVPLDSFAWSEEPYKVKIYVDFDKASELSELDYKFEWTVDSLLLKLRYNGRIHVFEIDALFDRISNATIKKKSDKFLITLTKEKEKIWYKIRF